MCFCFLFNFRLSFCKLLLIRLSCLKYNRQNWLQQTQETKHRTGCVAISAGDSGGRAGGRADGLRRYFCWRLGRAGGRAGGQAASLFLLATRVGGGMDHRTGRAHWTTPFQHPHRASRHSLPSHAGHSAHCIKGANASVALAQAPLGSNSW